jgi:hypothetical protein
MRLAPFIRTLKSSSSTQVTTYTGKGSATGGRVRLDEDTCIHLSLRLPQVSKLHLDSFGFGYAPGNTSRSVPKQSLAHFLRRRPLHGYIWAMRSTVSLRPSSVCYPQADLTIERSTVTKWLCGLNTYPPLVKPRHKYLDPACPTVEEITMESAYRRHQMYKSITAMGTVQMQPRLTMPSPKNVPQ